MEYKYQCESIIPKHFLYQFIYLSLEEFVESFSSFRQCVSEASVVGKAQQ